ncbi:MAG: cupin domain-containing protein [Gammaproteobacteria bacterium]|nr:cupin domain-containing protein [Gammaproteobacteria bacterium]
MRKLHNVQSPRISFAEEEQLTEHVSVYPFALAKINCQAPFKITLFTIAPQQLTPIDQHDVVEIWTILSGYGELYYENNVVLAKACDIFYFSSQKQHQIKNTSAEIMKIQSIYW